MGPRVSDLFEQPGAHLFLKFLVALDSGLELLEAFNSELCLLNLVFVGSAQLAFDRPLERATYSVGHHSACAPHAAHHTVFRSIPILSSARILFPSLLLHIIRVITTFTLLQILQSSRPLIKTQHFIITRVLHLEAHALHALDRMTLLRVLALSAELIIAFAAIDIESLRGIFIVQCFALGTHNMFEENRFFGNCLALFVPVLLLVAHDWLVAL